MANPVKGDVSFEHNGTSYRLRYSTNALCELEEKMGDGVMQVAAKMQNVDKMRVGTMRAMFWAGLLDQNPDLSEADAGKVMDAIGILKAVELCGEAFGLAFPGSGGGPLAGSRRQGGTGRRS